MQIHVYQLTEFKTKGYYIKVHCIVLNSIHKYCMHEVNERRKNNDSLSIFQLFINCRVFFKLYN